MPRYKIIIEYCGTYFSGWQKVDTGASVQATLQEACLRLCGEQVDIIAAGRTDAGVHAAAQVAHIDLPRYYEPFAVMSALNFHLQQIAGDGFPRGIAVLQAEEVTEAFHARFSARARHYEYRILNRRPPSALREGRVWHISESLNADAMHEAAGVLVGHHDFTTFRDTQCQSKSPEKTLEYLDVSRRGDEIIISTGARSFLHHQVRILVGTLRLCGNGKWNADDMRAALYARDRRVGGPTAPPDGLTLIRVDY